MSMTTVPCTVLPRPILFVASEPLTGMFGADCGTDVARKALGISSSAVVKVNLVRNRISFQLSQILSKYQSCTKILAGVHTRILAYGGKLSARRKDVSATRAANETVNAFRLKNRAKHF